MTTTIEAVYEGGVFRPTAAVVLQEGTHVEVLIPQTSAARDPKLVASKLSQIAATATRGGQSESTSRDHDQILYGEDAQR